MNNSITTLKRGNHLLKQQYHNQGKENRRLEMLTRHIFEQLKERENDSRNCQKHIELESVYQEEIHKLKEQVSILEADYKTLQNQLNNKVNHSDINLKNVSNLILLYSQNLNLVEKKNKSDQDYCKEFHISTIFSNFFETLHIIKNDILGKGITYRFVEVIAAVKDRISTILSNFSQFLNVVKKYILEKDLKSRFVEYTDAVRNGISTSFELIQKVSMCLEQEGINVAYRRKMTKIRDSIDILLEELEELNSDINT